ncbi:MAG: response regulator [Verrucomicrobiales bacterium]|nr:response regulator [Verrucomicrobiales bacterium]
MPEIKSPKKKILVVDDEPMVCEAIGMLLKFDGHEVVAASHGQEALALFERDRFDLVITDYHMPGMRGDELTLALKALLPGQPVIMITAYAEMLKTSAVPLMGVDQLINKPFQLQELRDAIQKLLPVDQTL